MIKKYEKNPMINAKEFGSVAPIKDLVKKINSLKYKNILIETYPGVDLNDIKNKILDKVNKIFKIFWSEDYALQGNDFRNAIMSDLTNDRVFGRWTRSEYKDFFNKSVSNKSMSEFNIFYGTGANYLHNNFDLVVYVDINRWEIQNRYRNNKRVFFGGTLESENISNFKRGYFVEWRMADKIKEDIIKKMDFYVDGNNSNFKTIQKSQFEKLLDHISRRPFRLVPYFDYGVWGGNWMEKNLLLGKNKFSRWAWGFDGVPEENSVSFNLSNDFIEMPAINLMLFRGKVILGERVWNRFGNDYPIRFDFLDTINGQNLSLQVHPDFKYIREKFWAPYTQEESYYILDIDEKADPKCYLGMKDNVKPNKFISALKDAQKTNSFNVEKYINVIPVKKHDHLIHPSGVVHSSGAGCMILEISATPYIFTFKLWDWARKGLNGLPRPINIEHGENVIDYSFNEQKTWNELVNTFTEIRNDDNIMEEKTGLHPRQYIETRRITIKPNKKVTLDMHNSTNMLNLIDGTQVTISSNDESFEDIVINYAETFIVPESCKNFSVKSNVPNEKVMLIQAFVRTNA